MTTPVLATIPASQQEARGEDHHRALHVKIFAFDERLLVWFSIHTRSLFRQVAQQPPRSHRHAASI
jgi:hypothetical protein